MSVNLEQAPGTGGKVTEPPLHPCKPKDASSATAVPTPSFSSSRRVKLCIGPKSWMPSTKQRWDRLPSPACLDRSEEHTSELQSQSNIVCRLLLGKKKIYTMT